MYYTCCGLTTNVMEPSRRSGSCNYCDVSLLKSGHDGIGTTPRGDLVSIFREPGERVKSGFFHNLHDCPSMENEFCQGQSSQTRCNYTRILHDVVDTFVRYWHCVEGCNVKMLSGHRPCTVQEFTRPTPESVAVAIGKI